MCHLVHSTSGGPTIQMWPKAKISGKTNKGQTNLFKTILTKCFSYARSNSCYIPGKSLKYIKEYIQMLTFNHLNEEESILFGHLTYTNSSRHGTTWKSIRTVSIDMVPPKNKTISVLRFSQILLQMQLYWSLKDHLKITFIVLFPHLIKALPFSKSKGMVWLPIVFVCSTTTSSELSLPTRPHFYLTPVTPPPPLFTTLTTSW